MEIVVLGVVAILGGVVAGIGMVDAAESGWLTLVALACAAAVQICFGAEAWSSDRLYTCEQAQLATYERRVIDGREEQCMPDGRVWRLPKEVNQQ